MWWSGTARNCDDETESGREDETESGREYGLGLREEDAEDEVRECERPRFAAVTLLPLCDSEEFDLRLDRAAPRCYRRFTWRAHASNSVTLSVFGLP